MVRWRADHRRSNGPSDPYRSNRRGRIGRMGRWRPHRPRGDRGDVPGWVMVTLMTAGLVTALWVVAEPRLRDVFTTAIDSVLGGP